MTKHTTLPDWLVEARAQRNGSLDLPESLRVVFTGEPNSGKSSVAKRCSARGFTVVTEFAGQIIEEYERGEHKLHPIKECLHAFNEENFHRQVVAEAEVRGESLIINDRHFYDPEPYFLDRGLPVPDYLAQLPPNLCDIAFVFAPVPKWDNNGVRCEDPEWAKKLRPQFPKSYASKGVITIPVPLYECTDTALSTEDRIEKSIVARYEHIVKALKGLYPALTLPTTA